MINYDTFVDYIVKRCNEDNGIRAAFRHADNEKLEPRVWPYIYRFVDLNNVPLRRACVIVAWGIAKSDDEVSETFSLGTSYGMVKSDAESESKGFSKRFRRLLACDSLSDLLMVLPHDLKLFMSKGIALDYKSLLKDLERFQYDDGRERVKVSWAMDYLALKGDE